MDKASKRQTQTLNQLRMGLLGTLTAVVLCFAAAFTFSGKTVQETGVSVTSSTD